MLLDETENYVEYSRHGAVLKGPGKAVARSKYEDVSGGHNGEKTAGASSAATLWSNRVTAPERLASKLRAPQPVFHLRRRSRRLYLKTLKEKKKQKKKQGSASSDSDEEEKKKQKLNQVVAAEDVRLKQVEEMMKMDERKRKYNSLQEIKEPTEEEMEAFRMKRSREDDPMANFLELGQ